MQNTYYQWHMWATRQPPFNQLQDGDQVVIVASWPGGGRLLWDLAVGPILKESYSSRDEAVWTIATHLGVTRKDVLSEPYIEDKPNSGWVLAFRFHPLRRLDIPKPSDLKFRRNGWVAVEDQSLLASWGL